MTLDQIQKDLSADTCSTCNGSGKDENAVLVEDPGTNQTTGGDLPCGSCNGSGKSQKK